LLDDDVRGFDQRAQPKHRVCGLEVDGDAALAAVQHREGHAGVAESWLVTAQLLTGVRTLDLDHLRAGLPQQERGHRAGEQGGEIEHANA
jgi:hypothetical protein